MVMHTDGDRWIFPRDNRLTGTLAQLADRRDGIPVVAPELQLLYKARVPNRPEDDADLRRMIPRLTDRRRAWLREQIRFLYPDSPYRALLGMPSSGQRRPLRTYMRGRLTVGMRHVGSIRHWGRRGEM